MKKRIQQRAGLAGDVSGPRHARTGDHCPASGWWTPLNDEGTGHYITEGSVMPSVNGVPSRWKLVLGHPQRAQLPRATTSRRADLHSAASDGQDHSAAS